MTTTCPKCGQSIASEDPSPLPAACPQCQAPLSSPASTPPRPRSRSLLDDLLEEVRQFEAANPSGIYAANAAGMAVAAPVALPGAPPAERPSRRRKKEERGHFARRPSKAYQPRPAASRGPLYAVLGGVALIALAGYLAIHFIRSGIRKQAAETALRRANMERAAIEALLTEGDQLRAGEKFKDALGKYQEVVTRARPLLNELENSLLPLKPGGLYNQVETARQELSGWLTRAKAATEDPDVKYRAQGLVNVDGKWMTPEQQKAEFEARMKAEGRTLYEGKWLTQDEIHEAKGEVAYKGRWVTKEELAKLLAAEAAVTPVPPPTTTPAPRPPRTTAAAAAAQYAPDKTEWMLDDFEGPHRWSAVPWKETNPCTLSVVTGTETGRLKIAFPGGDYDKSAITRPLGLDFGSRSRLRLDVFNDTGEPLKLAIALQTNTYYESRYQYLKIGMNKDVTFDLTAGDYKCAATRWSPAARISRLNATTHLFLLFYNRSGEVLLDNIRALGGQ